MDTLDRWLEDIAARLTRISEFWFVPMFWGIGFTFWITSNDWALEQHWTTIALLTLALVPLALITLLPLGLLTVALWVALLPLVILYAVARQIAKLWN